MFLNELSWFAIKLKLDWFMKNFTFLSFRISLFSWTKNLSLSWNNIVSTDNASISRFLYLSATRSYTNFDFTSVPDILSFFSLKPFELFIFESNSICSSNSQPLSSVSSLTKIEFLSTLVNLSLISFMIKLLSSLPSWGPDKIWAIES